MLSFSQFQEKLVVFRNFFFHKQKSSPPTLPPTSPTSSKQLMSESKADDSNSSMTAKQLGSVSTQLFLLRYIDFEDSKVEREQKKEEAVIQSIGWNQIEELANRTECLAGNKEPETVVLKGQPSIDLVKEITALHQVILDISKQLHQANRAALQDALKDLQAALKSPLSPDTLISMVDEEENGKVIRGLIKRAGSLFSAIPYKTEFDPVRSKVDKYLRDELQELKVTDTDGIHSHSQTEFPSLMKDVYDEIFFIFSQRLKTVRPEAESKAKNYEAKIKQMKQDVRSGSYPCFSEGTSMVQFVNDVFDLPQVRSRTSSHKMPEAPLPHLQPPVSSMRRRSG